MKNKKLENSPILCLCICIICFFFQGIALFSEEGITNYNAHYHYPFSFGIEYQNHFPLRDFVEDYHFLFFDVSGTLEIPLSFLPRLKPLASTGIMFGLGENRNVDNKYPDNKYNHTAVYCGLGLGYSYRFSKLLETGFEIIGGIDYSSFPYLHPDERTRSAYFIYADCKIPVTISPLYNLSIDLEPGIRYRQSIGPLEYFNGFLFSIGGTINFRIGEDPDIAGLIRSIRFSNIAIPSLFAGMQSYYREHPAGTVAVTNVEKYPVTDLNITFYQAGFMDSPTPALIIDQLKPGETREIPLFASFNAEIFNTEGITPLTGEIIITYTAKGKSGEQKESVLYDLYDKTSLTWDDDRKLGAYITPSDSVIKDYVSLIQQGGKEKVLATYNNPLQTAMLFYSALTEAGCLYQADPVLPFVTVQQDTAIIDTINLSRDTLKRISGDCDDLTVLYASMLESAGIETAYITLPGHVYPIFNTGIPARHFRIIHPQRSMTIILNGTLWVPVEVTMIGKEDFLQAWEEGAREWLAWEEAPEKRRLYITREAQSVYRSVGLKKRDTDFSPAKKNLGARGFEETLINLSRLVIAEFDRIATETGAEPDYNKLGIINAYFNKPDEAEKAFLRAITLNPDYPLARINLGNLFYQTNKYKDALSQYILALQIFKKPENDPSPAYLKLLLKISVLYYELKEYENAGEYFARAQKIAPEDTLLYSYVTSTENGEIRSSELPGYTLVLEYLEDEDL